MIAHTIFPLALAIAAAPILAAPPLPVQGISQDIYNRLVHFTKIAMGTYAGENCTIPSLPRLGTFYNATTEIYGWVLRDHVTRELIISFRGTASIVNRQQNANWTLGDISATLPICHGCKVQGTYYLAWLSVMDQVFSLIREKKRRYPRDGIVVTGHSLGGSLAAICSAHLVPHYNNVTTYTFGEPRAGNLPFALFLDKHFNTCTLKSTRYFRTTHADDGIVPIPRISDGYAHQGLELWSLDPNSPNNTFICPSEGFCCEQTGVQPAINAAHGTYFNVTVGTCSRKV